MNKITRGLLMIIVFLFNMNGIHYIIKLQTNTIYELVTQMIIMIFLVIEFFYILDKLEIKDAKRRKRE